jgi:hypothetical protein
MRGLRTKAMMLERSDFMKAAKNDSPDKIEMPSQPENLFVCGFRLHSSSPVVSVSRWT